MPQLTDSNGYGMHVSLPALKAFEAAARLGSFKLAAQELNLSPTAISHHISNLEQRLDVALFQRQARRITLTAAGERLATVTTQGFAAIAQTLADIADSGRRIHISTTSSLAALVLIPALQQFYTRFPQTRVEVSSGENLQHDAFTLPLRLGNAVQQASDDIVKTEQFNMFAAASAPGLDTRPALQTIYTTEWKNPDLSAPPLAAWLAQHQLPATAFSIKPFDQELFGISQALCTQAWVFSSTTLTRPYVQAGILRPVSQTPVASGLCYYIPHKAQRINRHNEHFINWLEDTLNA